MTALTAALINLDIDAAQALLCDEVVLFYSNGSALAGKPAFAAAMTASWAIVSRYAYTTQGVRWLAQSDEAATVIYSFAWSGVARGNAVSGCGRGTRVFRRDPSGWRMVHEHLSSGQWPAP